VFLLSLISFFFSYNIGSDMIVVTRFKCKQSVAREFAVEAMPTFIFIKKGEVVDKLVGATKEGLQKKIEKHRT
jgi:thioredoxin-like negative regulator of GroEL